MTTRLPSRPAAWIRRSQCGSSYLCSFRLQLAFSISLQLGTSRRPRLVGPCTDLARGDQSLPSTGGPCSDSARFEAPPSSTRGPALTLARPSPHSSEAQPFSCDAQPSLLRGPRPLPTRARCHASTLLRLLAAPSAFCFASTLLREHAAYARTPLSEHAARESMLRREHAAPKATLQREHAAPRAR